MKKLILLITIAAILKISLFSQYDWHKAYDCDGISYPSSTAIFRDTILIIGMFVYPTRDHCTRQRVTAYTQSGKRLWRCYAGGNAIFTDSDYIYTAGLDDGASDVGNDELLTISKIDEAGNIVFHKYYDLPNIYWYEYHWPNSISVSPETGKILATIEDKVFITDSTGSTLDIDLLGSILDTSSIYPPLDTIIDSKPSTDIFYAGFCDEEYYLVAYDSSVIIYEYDEKLLEWGLSADFRIIQAEFFNDKVYLLSQNEIFILNDWLEYIDTITFNDITEPDAFRIDNNSFWIKGKNELKDKLRILKINELHETDSIYDIDTSAVRDNVYFEISDNWLSLISSSKSRQTAIISYDINNIYDIKFDDDISIKDIRLYNFHPSGDYFYGFNADLTFKNEGDDTIRSFTVYSLLYDFGWHCQDWVFNQRYSDIEILPQDTILIDGISLSRIIYANSDLCIECKAPNSKLEIKTADNELCVPYDPESIIDYTEHNCYEIFPVPVSDILTFKFPDAINKKIDIFNISGELILTETSAGNIINIDLSHIEPGIYIIGILRNNKIDYHKLVKN